MQPKLLKYILDIESVIEEIETIKQKSQGDFLNFSGDIILQRAVKRDLEIIGEAIRKVIDIEPDIQISSARNILDCEILFHMPMTRLSLYSCDE
jgi:uncharacterized protein with HEPN domain